jgi:hypothetical protein
MDKLQRVARFVESKMVRHAEKFQVRIKQGVLLVGN